MMNRDSKLDISSMRIVLGPLSNVGTVGCIVGGMLGKINNMLKK